VWHDSFICVTWLIHVRDMTHAYVWHDSFKCVTWLNTNHCLECPTPRARECVTHWCRSLCVYATWLIHLCDTLMLLTVCVCYMTHLYVWHADATHCVCVRHDSFICVTWRIHECDMTHLSAWHDSYHIYARVTSHSQRDTLMPLTVCVCDMTHLLMQLQSNMANWSTVWVCMCVCVCARVYAHKQTSHTHTHGTSVAAVRHDDTVVADWRQCHTSWLINIVRDTGAWHYDTGVADRLCACVCVYTCMRINKRVTHTHMTHTYVAHWSTCVT